MEKEIKKYRENKMGVMPVNKLLLSMSIPMVLSMLIQALYNVVDSIFVAQINESALTAVSLAFPIQNLMIAMAAGTGVGINALLSRSLGERNSKLVNKAAHNGLFLAVLSYLTFLIFSIVGAKAFFMSQTSDLQIIEYGTTYISIVCMFSFGIFAQITLERLLSSTGKTFYTLLTQGTGAIVNIILDPILIFGLFGAPKLGVAGAAIATVIGQSIGMSLGIYFNLKKNHEIQFSFKGFRPEWKVIKKIYAVGLPSIVLVSIGSIMVYGFNQILLSFTTTATAVFGIFFKLQSFIIMPVLGLNNGMVPIIAYNFGAKQKERIIHTIKLSAIYATCITFIGLLLMQLFPAEILQLFNANESMVFLGIPALRIISLNFVFAGFSIVSVSAFQALGHGLLSLFVSAIRQLVVILPVAYLLSLTGSVNMIWWAFPIAEVAAFIICLGFFRRVYRLEIKNLGENQE